MASEPLTTAIKYSKDTIRDTQVTDKAGVDFGLVNAMRWEGPLAKQVEDSGQRVGYDDFLIPIWSAGDNKPQPQPENPPKGHGENS